ncbi:MAG: FtsH protease activity modulator HflK [Gammaproteobacteria bacterium]|nr:FtsH protease activity modulator HflK [Gammaproteobacteria bacterium]
MAWNEPGGSGKDPWGSQGGDQGPPDLDELARKFQQKLGGLFGGKGGGSGTGGGRGAGGASRIGLGLVLGALVAVWVFSGIYIVAPAERAVVLQFGRYVKTTGPGPHWVPRFIQTVEKVNVEQIRNIQRQASMLTQDENIISVALAVQYRVKDIKDYVFLVRDPDLTLREATESAVREVIGKSKLDFALTEGRSEIMARTETLIQEILDRYGTGLQITSVNLQDAQPPEQVQGAFEDAIKAREDEQRLKNEAEAYANEIVPVARGKAARQLEEANAYKAQVIAQAEGEASRFEQLLTEYRKSPAVTRQRLYLETMESVLASSSKVMVDVEGGNNLMYLPLDQLMQRGAEAQARQEGGALAPVGGTAIGSQDAESRGREDLRSRRGVR